MTYTNAQELTADELNSWLPIAVQKNAATSRATVIVPAADPDLVLPLLGTYTYEGVFNIFISSAVNAAGDWRGVLHWTSGTLTNGMNGLSNALASGFTGTSTTSPTTRLDIDGTGTEVIMGASTSGLLVQIPFYISMGAADGTVSLWWAQETSNANNTVVLEGSWAVAKRVK